MQSAALILLALVTAADAFHILTALRHTPLVGSRAVHGAAARCRVSGSSVLRMASEESEALNGVLQKAAEEADQMWQEQQRRPKNNAIHDAAIAGDVGRVKELVGEGANLLEAGLSYRSCLHFAASGGHTEVARVLCEEGGDDLVRAACSEQRNNALHYAARDGAPPELVGMLIEQGGEELLVARNLYGSTPLHLAAYGGYVEAAELLIGAGGEGLKSLKNEWGKTPLDLARSNGVSGAMVDLLK